MPHSPSGLGGGYLCASMLGTWILGVANPSPWAWEVVIFLPPPGDRVLGGGPGHYILPCDWELVTQLGT